MATATTGLTIEDFEKLPHDLAVNHELVDGELIDVSGNTPPHNILKMRLASRLDQFALRNKTGQVIPEQEYRFGDDAHGPDISFLQPEKTARVVEKRVQPFVPDLAIEIVSPNDVFSNLLGKVHKYLRYGTAEVWVIDMDFREVYVYTTGRKKILGENELLETELIPGFSVRIGDLFEA